MRRFTRALLILTLILAAGRASAQAAAPSVEDAIRAAIEADGAVYAGPCADTRSPDDLDKVCSRHIAEQEGVHAYLAGRTFSEFTTWLFVQQTGEGWQVSGSAPLNFLAQDMQIPWP